MRKTAKAAVWKVPHRLQSHERVILAPWRARRHEPEIGWATGELFTRANLDHPARRGRSLRAAHPVPRASPFRSSAEPNEGARATWGCVQTQVTDMPSVPAARERSNSAEASRRCPSRADRGHPRSPGPRRDRKELVRQRDDGQRRPSAPRSPRSSTRHGPARRAVRAARRPRHVRHVQGKRPRVGDQPIRQAPKGRREVAEVAQQRVEHSGRRPQAQRGVRTDAAKTLDWIGLVQRQVDDEERVAIGGLGALRLAVEADGHLHRNGPARIAVARHNRRQHRPGASTTSLTVAPGTSAFAARASLPSGRGQGHDARGADDSVEGRRMAGPSTSPRSVGGRRPGRRARSAARAPASGLAGASSAARRGARGPERPPAGPRGPPPRGAARSRRRPCCGGSSRRGQPAVREGVDDVEGPEGAERSRRSSITRGECRVRHGRPAETRPAADVLAHVEPGVVDPRSAPCPSSRSWSCGEARRAADTLSDTSTERLRIGSGPALGRVEDRDLQRVACHRGGLEPEDRDVLGAKQIHRVRGSLLSAHAT